MLVIVQHFMDKEYYSITIQYNITLHTLWCIACILNQYIFVIDYLDNIMLKTNFQA